MFTVYSAYTYGIPACYSMIFNCADITLPPLTTPENIGLITLYQQIQKEKNTEKSDARHQRYTTPFCELFSGAYLNNFNSQASFDA